MENINSCRICVLMPDYSTSQVDYQHYDPPRNLSHLLPDAHFDHVFLNKLTVYKQLRELSKKNYDIFINLCEGYLDWGVPSIDVIYYLDLLNLPYTGPNQLLYDPTKQLMKYVAYTQEVKTPKFFLVERTEDVAIVLEKFEFPLFVKPSKAGDSLGIDDSALVRDEIALKNRVGEIIDEYGPLLVEEYIDGREFTVMLVRNAGTKDSVTVFKPVEYLFPKGKKFKTYALKTSELHTNANVSVEDKELCVRLQESATAIFNGFGGVGYARLDFRLNSSGVLYFLEINFTCSVFYQNGYEGSADYILKIDGTGQDYFLKKIIEEGWQRHQDKQKKYEMRGDAIAGYGIYAAKDLLENEIVFKGEERSQRVATLPFIEKNWNESELQNFRRYAYPLSKNVFLLWDENPAEWAPQNHCCEANTFYIGLDVVTKRKIKKGEELTLDYTDFLDENMEPFNCSCKSEKCRGFVVGKLYNSVDSRMS